MHILLSPHQGFHHLLHGLNPVSPVSIASAEQKGMIQIPLRGIGQRAGDAVGNVPGITVLQTLVTVANLRLVPGYIVQKSVLMARPGIPTGLLVMTISSFLASIYACL